MYPYQITIPCENKQFHKEIADGINKDHPNKAKLMQCSLGFYVGVTSDYMDECKQYVLEHCKVKKMKH